MDFGSETTLNDAVEAAERAETLIYSIVYSDPGVYGLFGSGRDGNRVLRRMPNDSGGNIGPSPRHRTAPPESDGSARQTANGAIAHRTRENPLRPGARRRCVSADLHADLAPRVGNGLPFRAVAPVPMPGVQNR